MFNDEYKTIQRMLPLIQRVLIIDPQPASARVLAETLKNFGRFQIHDANTTARGLALAEAKDPQIVFVELSGPGVDGVDFTRKLRRSEAACRQAPVIVTTSTATAASIMQARDAGVHEFLRKPFTTRDLLRRLEAVTLRPRDWIEAVHYVGPDRRRFNSGDYAGPLKRRSDPRETPVTARIVQALKIVKAAVDAAQSDPLQAMRALQAQAADLQKAAVETSNLKLSGAVADFRRYLLAAAEKDGIKSDEVAAQAAPLLALMPKDAPDARDAA